MTDKKLTVKAKNLLKRVQSTEGPSYELSKKEAELGKELVENGHCFYSMDYEHLIAYKH